MDFNNNVNNFGTICWNYWLLNACKIFNLILAILLHYLRKHLTTKNEQIYSCPLNLWVALKIRLDHDGKQQRFIANIQSDKEL